MRILYFAALTLLSLALLTSDAQAQGARLETYGNWQLVIEPNPGFGRDNAVAVVTDRGSGGSFVVGCVNGQIAVGWETGAFLDNARDVRVRIGNYAARTERWRSAGSNTLLIAADPFTIMEQLLTADRVELRITPYRSQTRIDSFSTNGAIAAISRVLSFCT